MIDVAYCQVYCTIDSREKAEALARGAVDARLAACAQLLGPMTSTYWWRGRVETAEEWLLLFKTPTERYPSLEAYLREQHSYEVPEIICTPITAGNPAYLSWVRTETQPL